MVKILDTCAALERFEWQRNGVDHGVDRGLPAVVDIVHAVIVGPEPMEGLRAEVLDATEPVFATHGRFVDAACGRHVRVLLPEPFDSEHPKACPRCSDAVGVPG